MATEKQKNYLLNLAKAKGAKLTESDINNMIRKQASKAIDTLKNEKREVKSPPTKYL